MASEDASSAPTVRVVSYNIELAGKKGIDPVVELLESIDADVVALQDVGRNWRTDEARTVDQVAVLSERLGYKHSVFVTTSRQGDDGTFGHAVLSRYPLERHGEFVLPQGREEQRRAYGASIELGDGVTADLVTTHVSDHAGERGAQHEALMNWLTMRFDASRPLILVGDLNEKDPRVLGPRLEALGLTDVGASESEPTWPSDAPSERRAVICARGFEVVEPLRVVGDETASGHRAVVVGLKLTGD